MYKSPILLQRKKQREQYNKLNSADINRIWFL